MAKTVGLFEAKTKLSALCQEVAATGQPLTITRRGAPLVRLEPVGGPDPTAHEGVWTRRARHLQAHGALSPAEEDFELPAPLPAARPDPLA